MLFPHDAQLLHHVGARLERYRAEARLHARVNADLEPRLAPSLRASVASGLARFARLLAAVAEDLDPATARARWEPRT